MPKKIGKKLAQVIAETKKAQAALTALTTAADQSLNATHRNPIALNNLSFKRLTLQTRNCQFDLFREAVNSLRLQEHTLF
jgi:hypothetical protein